MRLTDANEALGHMNSTFIHGNGVWSCHSFQQDCAKTQRDTILRNADGLTFSGQNSTFLCMDRVGTDLSQFQQCEWGGNWFKTKKYSIRALFWHYSNSYILHNIYRMHGVLVCNSLLTLPHPHMWVHPHIRDAQLRKINHEYFSQDYLVFLSLLLF